MDRRLATRMKIVRAACRESLEISAFVLSLLEKLYSSRISLRGRSAASLRQNCVTVFSFSKNHFSSPSRSEERFSRNAETDLVCRLLLEKKKNMLTNTPPKSSQRAPRAIQAVRSMQQ